MMMIWVPDTYIYEILKAVSSGPDAVALNGTMTIKGQFHATWDISMYNPYTETKRAGHMHYLRLSQSSEPGKKEIAIRFPFPDKRLYEDFDYATAMHKAQAIQSEVKVANQCTNTEYVNDPK